MVYTKTRISRREWNVKILKIQTDQLKLEQVLSNWKKVLYRLVDVAIPADYSVKIKGSEKIETYLDLAWELKKTKKNTVERKSDVDTNCN